MTRTSLKIRNRWNNKLKSKDPTKNKIINVVDEDLEVVMKRMIDISIIKQKRVIQSNMKVAEVVNQEVEVEVTDNTLIEIQTDKEKATINKVKICMKAGKAKDVERENHITGRCKLTKVSSSQKEVKMENKTRKL